MINESQKQESETPKSAISAEKVLSYVVIGCGVVAVIGVISALDSRSGSGGVSLLASAVALGVIAYIYSPKK